MNVLYLLAIVIQTLIARTLMDHLCVLVIVDMLEVELPVEVN
jgi:hypothetical protein